MTFKLSIAVLFFFSVICNQCTAADNYDRLGRYYWKKTELSAAQIDPLQQVVDIEFPSSVLTLANAYEFVLNPTGYSLAKAQYLDANFIAIINSPLPVSQRKLRGKVIDILNVLSGSSYVVVRDPFIRTIALDSVR